ncbi:hypothetical protein F0U62_19850 [Cystobacter fuscus]|uniref:hypothetical protein n=1 Tax=Cystobacter fuscus TaxID=43 RepID=UPI002B2A71B1|nr:hypothetical protein F0U62_19850 [Cystobacter fuscus]
MMKALKAGLFGLAMGAIGAVALPTQVAEAQTTPAQPPLTCCSYCNPNYVSCMARSTGMLGNAICLSQRSSCESTCKPGC